MREIQIVLEASEQRDARQAWMAAQYMAFAFHDPSNMPDDPIAAASSGTSAADDEIAAIRRRVKIEHDTRRSHGR